MDDILYRLSKSKFRNSFHLKEKDFEYINKVGLEKIRSHAVDFITKRQKEKLINDGKQTPMRGHPVFIAEHATATCCRGCINKWYHIPEDNILTEKQIEYLVDIIMKWIHNEIKNNTNL